VTAYTRGQGNPWTGTITTVTITSGDDAVQPAEHERLAAVLVGQ
jgi:hypothetical protein